MKKLLLFIGLLFLQASAYCATWYAVATGNWMQSGVTWSNSSGGSPVAGYPVAGDTVYLNAASGAITVTVDAPSACASIICTGFTGTLTMLNSMTTTGAVTFSPGMTFTPNSQTWNMGCSAVSLTTANKKKNEFSAFLLKNTILAHNSYNTPTKSKKP